jgi:hypothetical protein
VTSGWQNPKRGANGRKCTKESEDANLLAGKQLRKKARIHWGFLNLVPGLPLSPPHPLWRFSSSFSENPQDHDSLCLSTLHRRFSDGFPPIDRTHPAEFHSAVPLRSTQGSSSPVVRERPNVPVAETHFEGTRRAQVANPHFHRFRDAFAVSLLEKGVPLENVSVLLGHSSVKITEKHYAPWVKKRQEILEEQVKATWQVPA